MSKCMKSCEKYGIYLPKVTNFAVNSTNFERRLYYYLLNLTTTLNLSSSFKKSIVDVFPWF